MKKSLKFLTAAIILMICLCQSTFGAVAKYKEDYYKLYHVHYLQSPDDCIENIWYLEQAVKADFANPYYALVHIENEEQCEKYRYLFQMQLNLKLIEQHLRLARVYDKKVAYFYDAPWKDEYLRNLQTARTYYEACYYYWDEAKLWAEKANTSNLRFLFITQEQDWEDKRERICMGELDYHKILDREIQRLDKVIEDLNAMESSEY